MGLANDAPISRLFAVMALIFFSLSEFGIKILYYGINILLAFLSLSLRYLYYGTNIFLAFSAKIRKRPLGRFLIFRELNEGFTAVAAAPFCRFAAFPLAGESPERVRTQRKHAGGMFLVRSGAAAMPQAGRLQSRR